MPIETNLARYSCAVAGCDHSKVGPEEKIDAVGYRQARHIDVNGVEGEPQVLCDEHGKMFEDFAQRYDETFNHFMKTGEILLASVAELEAIKGALEQCQADLEAMTKKRDGWRRKYDALKAEMEGGAE